MEEAIARLRTEVKRLPEGTTRSTGPASFRPADLLRNCRDLGVRHAYCRAADDQDDENTGGTPAGYWMKSWFDMKQECRNASRWFARSPCERPERCNRSRIPPMVAAAAPKTRGARARELLWEFLVIQNDPEDSAADAQNDDTTSLQEEPANRACTSVGHRCSCHLSLGY